MISDAKHPSLNSLIRGLFLTPIASHRQWGLVLAVALAYTLIPQLPLPNDWALNTSGLSKGLNAYADGSFVYPPWALILLWPYRWLTIPGTRAASVLVVGWLASKRRWTLLRFSTIVISPYFIWTMILCNLDVLSLLLPVLLWETAEGKAWRNVGRSVSCLLLLLKPQSGILMIIYLCWRHRQPIRGLLAPLVVVMLVTIPISALGKPPLFYQWIQNTIIDPSRQNLEYWRINNTSLTAHVGWLPGSLIVAASLCGTYLLMRSLDRKWAEQHTYAGIFAVSMLLGPYASNQGLIVPLALLASWPALVMQYVVLYIAPQVGVGRENSTWWALTLVIGALCFYRPVPDEPRDGLVSSRGSSGSD